MFALGGVGMFQARLVIVTFFLASCILTYAITRKLHGPYAALFALAMFILVSHGGPGDIATSALVMGRQAIAEVPALLFLLAGMLVWLIAFDRRSMKLTIASGVLFGFAVAVKSQFLLAVLPMWVVLAAVDRLFYRQRRLRYFVAPLAAIIVVVALHQLFYFIFLGPANYARFIDDLSDASGPQVRVFLSRATLIEAARLFSRSPYSILFFPALAYILVSYLRRDPKDIRTLVPTVFVIGWLTWYVLASVGWYRYAFPGLAVSYILTARFLAEFGGFDASFTRRAGQGVRLGNPAVLARGLAVVVMTATMVIMGARDAVPSIVGATDDTARQMAAFIDANVVPGERIDTWEWEVSFLAAEHDFHYPPTRLLSGVIAQQELDGVSAVDRYNPLDHRPNYILVGRFADWTGLYSADFLDRHGSLVTSIGPYKLYRVTPDSANTNQP
jgi:hypothetical protein